MKCDVYYFSGTGNSLYVARRIAEITKGNLKSIPQTISRLPIEDMCSHIIIVFPSYLALLYGVPVIVKEFIERIPDISTKTIKAICTCGGYEVVNAIPSVNQLSKIIRANGGQLSEYYTVRLPMNNLDYDHIPVPIERDEKVIFDTAEKKIRIIGDRLQGKKGIDLGRMGSTIFQVFMLPLYALMKKVSYRSILTIAKEPEDSAKQIEDVFRLTDRSIIVDERCNGCGICARVCPVKNIELVDEKPVWQHRCEMCFACHEWCPQKAIHHWGRKDGIYYHHPEVTLRDMVNGKG